MPLLRPLILALLVACSLPLTAFASGNPAESALNAPSDDATGFELLTQSQVGFWRGMSKEEFESRTTAKTPSQRVLSLGEFEFSVRGVDFDPQQGLVAASVEYRNDDPAKIEAAYEAYKRALGDLKPDYVRSAPNGTPGIPDLKFDMMGWRSPDGAESALARVHSFAGKAKSKDAVSAGIVTFALRRR
jgi:hypothetical protein